MAKRQWSVAGSVAVLLAVPWALPGCGSDPAADTASRLQSAGVPPELPARRRALEALELPVGVDDLAWLRFPVRELTVAELGPATAATLPQTLESLRVSGFTSVERLEALPPTLQRLTIADAAIGAVGELPVGLVEIELRGVHDFDPGRFPSSIQRIGLIDTPVRDIHGFPASVRTLRLAGRRVASLDGLPTEVEALTLADTLVSSLEPLPATLHALELEGNPLLEPLQPEDLPPYLVELSLVRHDIRELDSLPASLRSLRIRGGWDPTELLGVLPPSLNQLDLELADPPADVERERSALCDLPPHLESLSLLPARRVDPGCLPPGLRELYLVGTDRAIVSALGAELRVLAVTDTADLVDDDLEAMPENLQALDISFTGVRDLSRLARELPSLTELRCRGSLVERVSELPRGLVRLDLAGSPGLVSLEGLAGSSPVLEVLDLSGTAVDTLAHVPRSVIELDIRSTPIDRLDGVPPNLRKLTVASGQLLSLQGLPETIESLAVVGVP